MLDAYLILFYDFAHPTQPIPSKEMLQQNNIQPVIMLLPWHTLEKTV